MALNKNKTEIEAEKKCKQANRKEQEVSFRLPTGRAQQDRVRPTVYRKRKKQTRTKRQTAGKVKKRPDRKRWEAEKNQGKERRRSTAWRTPARRQEGFLRLTWFAFQSHRTWGKG